MPHTGNECFNHMRLERRSTVYAPLRWPQFESQLTAQVRARIREYCRDAPSTSYDAHHHLGGSNGGGECAE